MAYMLVKLQVRYGMVPKFSEIMTHLLPMLEKRGWRLRGAWVNVIGRLNRCYDLWELPDANSVKSVLEEVTKEPGYEKWADGLAECLEAEQLEILEKLPYAS